MKTSNILELWKTGSYTEDMMIPSFGSHLAFRTALIQADIKCPAPCVGVHVEIYRESSACMDERYESIEWVSKSYGISRANAVRFINTPPDNVKMTVSDEQDIRELAAIGMSPLAIANRLGCSSYKIRKVIGLTRATVSDATKADILADLVAGYAHKDIALKYGVSESTVSNINPNKISKPKRKPLSTRSWNQLKGSMNQHSISELSRMYNISRAYIYARLAKETEE